MDVSQPSRDPGLDALRLVILVPALALVVLAFGADWLGLGGEPGLGTTQKLLLVVAAILVIFAWALRFDAVRGSLLRLVFSRAGLALLGLVASLCIAELATSLVERVRNPWRVAEHEEFGSVPDPMLEMRLVPHVRGTDEKGFRNDHVPSRADVVAIGDSQTWGMNARRADAWPQNLERLSGLTTYNMALPGYGPVQYWVLTEEALEFSPRVVIIGLYFGNDLWDAYRSVYTLEAHEPFRDPSAGPELAQDTVGPRAKALEDEWTDYQEPFRSEWGAWLHGQSAFIRLLHSRGFWPATIQPWRYFHVGKAWSADFPNHGAVYENGSVRTVFKTAYRLLALDFDEPRIVEGMRITKEVLLLMRERMSEAGVELRIVLIPTKEMVYASEMERSSPPPDETYIRLTQMEARARDALRSFCNENGIYQVDALPSLRTAIGRGVQIYPQGSDGHPIAQGYSIVSEVVLRALRQYAPTDLATDRDSMEGPPARHGG